MFYPCLYRYFITILLLFSLVFHVVLAHHEGFHEWGVVGHHHDTKAHHDAPGYPDGSHHRDIEHPEFYTTANNTDSLDLLTDKISFLQVIETLGRVTLEPSPIHQTQLTELYVHPPPRQREQILTTTILLI